MTLGVLGGVGPAATVHFLERLVAVTPARRDQDHIETVVYNDPTIPDRTAAIRGTDDVRDHLVANARALDGLGVAYLVIASNLTHYWYDDVAAAVGGEVLHLVRLAADAVRERGFERVGLLTTTTAREVGLYEPFLPDVELVYPPDMAPVMDAIYQYKAGDEAAAQERTHAVARPLAAEVDALVLGCTEFSAMAWPGSWPTVDPIDVVARECVRRLAPAGTG